MSKRFSIEYPVSGKHSSEFRSNDEAIFNRDAEEYLSIIGHSI